MAGKENGAGEVEQGQDFVIEVDKSDEMILQLNMDKKFHLKWNFESFRKLDEKVVLQLRPENMRAYLMAEATWTNLERVNNAKKVEVVDNPFNPTEGDAEYRERIRPRKGWHQAWKNPGRDLDTALMGPYQQVRKPADGKTEEAGKETGEILKRLDSEGKIEAVAVECRDEHYKQYLEWMSRESRGRYEKITENFATGIANINSGMSKNDGRITPLDGSGKPLA